MTSPGDGAVTLVEDPTALASHLAAIDRDGFTIVPDAIEDDLVARLRDTLRRLQHELDVPVGESSFEGHATRRIPG